VSKPTPLTIYEVSPRDGLQNESTIVSTQDKLGLITRLVDAGIQDIEVTSFVKPSWIPQLADAAELVERLPQVDGVRYWGLVPNRVAEKIPGLVVVGCNFLDSVFIQLGAEI